MTYNNESRTDLNFTLKIIRIYIDNNLGKIEKQIIVSTQYSRSIVLIKKTVKNTIV